MTLLGNFLEAMWHLRYVIAFCAVVTTVALIADHLMED